MCYDPQGDRVLLFGGGLATNPTGAAPTWIFDCARNLWHRPKLDAEPPPRCNAPIVYDPATQSMVMFGGYNQAAALNDTWVYDCRRDRWDQRAPNLAPPPMLAPATAVVPGGGHVLVCGNDARKVKLHHQASTSAVKQTWVYDVAEDRWKQLETSGSAAIGREAVYIARHDTVLWLGERLFALDCQTGHMAELDVGLPKGLYTHECAMVYDPRHDVCVALIPRSFSGPMQTFLFRFDPKTARRHSGTNRRRQLVFRP